MIDYVKVTDDYQLVRAEREQICRDFAHGNRNYLIFQTPSGNVWGDVRTSEQSFNENIDYIHKSLSIKSDHIPALEPWFGTGLFANIFGCPYVWREGESPAVRYKYHHMDEIVGIQKPDWRKSEIALLALDTIKYFKNKTGDAIPIVWTDTQSASDTATMILDASEVLVGCLLEPELMFDFMKLINDVTIEFSCVQAELIGDCLIKPGHLFLSSGSFSGMSISDDNLAVASPDVNKGFNLVLNNEIGKAMDGVAIHSCGDWTYTMPFIKELVPTCVAIDCGVDKVWDPNPCDPILVRDAFSGTGIYVHVRLTGETEIMVETIKKMLHPELKLIVHPMFIDSETADRNYRILDEMLADYFG